MSDLLNIITELDQNEEIHLTRLLVLLKAFKRDEDTAIEGITKLAKLDFLLRYPSYFEIAMKKRGVSEKRLEIEDYEKDSIEAKMVRYRYGPWDHRYRRFLNILAAKGLVTLVIKGRTISIDLTNKGAEVALEIAQLPSFDILLDRADLLKKHLDLGATNLMRFIYDTFPELHEMSLNTEISAEQFLP